MTRTEDSMTEQAHSRRANGEVEKSWGDDEELPRLNNALDPLRAEIFKIKIIKKEKRKKQIAP